jgi:hypothetical protein
MLTLVASPDNSANVAVVLAARAAATRLATATKDLGFLHKAGVREVKELRQAAQEVMLADVNHIVASWKLANLLESMSAVERAALNEITDMAA